MSLEADKRVRVAGALKLEEVFCLVLKLRQAGMRGQRSTHDEHPFIWRLMSARPG